MQQHQQQQHQQQQQQLQQVTTHHQVTSQEQVTSQQQQYQLSNGQSVQSSSSVKRQARKNRVNFTQDQLTVLEKAFEVSAYPDAMKREEIAKLADLPETRVQVRYWPVICLRILLDGPAQFFTQIKIFVQF